MYTSRLTLFEVLLGAVWLHRLFVTPGIISGFLIRFLLLNFQVKQELKDDFFFPMVKEKIVFLILLNVLAYNYPRFDVGTPYLYCVNNTNKCS
jgi:hypothetical protein